jgi:hypothetical protein
MDVFVHVLQFCRFPPDSSICMLSACLQVGPAYREKFLPNPQKHIFALNSLFSIVMRPILMDIQQCDSPVEKPGPLIQGFLPADARGTLFLRFRLLPCTGISSIFVFRKLTLWN